MGRDLPDDTVRERKEVFQSTLPVWGGTEFRRLLFNLPHISIHPPRVGRDGVSFALFFQEIVISIHPPRVGRDQFGPCGIGWRYISIHPPRVGRDSARLYKQQLTLISIHPPRVGRDDIDTDVDIDIDGISIHPPRVGRDRKSH